VHSHHLLHLIRALLSRYIHTVLFTMLQTLYTHCIPTARYRCIWCSRVCCSNAQSISLFKLVLVVMHESRKSAEIMSPQVSQQSRTRHRLQWHHGSMLQHMTCAHYNMYTTVIIHINCWLLSSSIDTSSTGCDSIWSWCWRWFFDATTLLPASHA
jgi:hypothetical protein